MPLNMQGYFNCLRSYLNTDDFEHTKKDGDRILLEEDIYPPGSKKKKKQRVRFECQGDVIVIKLDKVSDPLFRFLDNQSKPWSKRCDFVIFQFHQNRIKTYCIEFKSASFPDSLCDQLEASEAWCRALHSTIKHYTTKNKRMYLTKYVFSCHETPEAYLDNDGYLIRDHSIKHYHYDDLIGMSLDDLANTNVEEIR